METSLLCVHSDILTALDDTIYVLLIILDLSTAFNMIDHPTLLSRLVSMLGLSGKALVWFSIYLSKQVQSVLIEGVESSLWKIDVWDPSGVCVMPHSFYNLHQPPQNNSTKAWYQISLLCVVSLILQISCHFTGDRWRHRFGDTEVGILFFCQSLALILIVGIWGIYHLKACNLLVLSS